jgi:hypothetical protein
MQIRNRARDISPTNYTLGIMAIHSATKRIVFVKVGLTLFPLFIAGDKATQSAKTVRSQNSKKVSLTSQQLLLFHQLERYEAQDGINTSNNIIIY